MLSTVSSASGFERMLLTTQSGSDCSHLTGFFTGLMETIKQIQIHNQWVARKLTFPNPSHLCCPGAWNEDFSTLCLQRLDCYRKRIVFSSDSLGSTVESQLGWLSCRSCWASIESRSLLLHFRGSWQGSGTWCQRNSRWSRQVDQDISDRLLSHCDSSITADLPVQA